MWLWCESSKENEGVEMQNSEAFSYNLRAATAEGMDGEWNGWPSFEDF